MDLVQGCPLPQPTSESYSIELSECIRLYHTMDSSREVFAPDYPPGVVPKNRALDAQTGISGLELMDCQQSVAGTEVQQGFQLLTFYGSIDQPNPDEKNITFSLYLFQSYTTSRSLAENASRIYGVEVALVNPIELRINRLPNAPIIARAANHSFEAPEGAYDYRVTGHVDMAKQSVLDANDAFYFLNATGALNHYRLNWQGSLSGSLDATVQFGPKSYWAEHSNVGAWEAATLQASDVSANLTFRRGI